jgi:fluoride ion exporter CrcB/FEX
LASSNPQQLKYTTIEPAKDGGPAAGKKHYRQKASPYEHIVYFCSLSVASYAGVFARIYLSELVKWDGVPLLPSLCPQLVGTAIMGLVMDHKLLLTDSFVYPAIATGLCGSITTFSSWNSEAVVTLLQSGEAVPNNGVRVVGWATTLLLGLGMSSGALTLGHHLASLSPWADFKQQNKNMKPAPADPSSQLRAVEGAMFGGAWVAMTALVVILPILFGRKDLLFSALFAALGTYLRWHLSPLNSAFKRFKLGTFLANVAGAWLLGGVVYIQSLLTEGTLTQDLLTGVSTGFCGCLTTVSTFAVELSGLPLGPSYLYAISSIILAQLGMILVISQS